jgi:hypothetical protein
MSKKCEFRKKNRESCGADAQIGKNLCVFHDPARADDGRRARQAGGVRRSQAAAVLPSDTQDHPLGDANQVSALLADSINQLRRGQLDPRVANGIGYLASVLLKALDQRLEERLAHLEAIVSGTGETEAGVFEFRSTKETKHEESSTARQGD